MELILGWLANMLTFGWKKRREADIALFKELYSKLMFNSDSAVLLRDHNFSHSFPLEYLIPLNHISEDWTYPDAKLHSWFVERKKKVFISDLSAFLEELELHTRMEDNGQISIGMHEKDKRTKSDKKAIAKMLNKLSKKAYRSYEKLFKKYKSELMS
ncbi:MAG: hypothetical protein V7784_22125 [Oceanospirillaceae bacterium]